MYPYVCSTAICVFPVQQFFARYFNLEAQYNNRFITLDSLTSPTEADVFAVLDSYVTDDEIGDAFFHDHYRMRQGE